MEGIYNVILGTRIYCACSIIIVALKIVPPDHNGGCTYTYVFFMIFICFYST